jgi:serine/threonine protein phosphatase PrpC
MTETIPAAQSGTGQGGRFVLEVVLKSDVGLVRSENQDFGLFSAPGEMHAADERLMMVADGMGGHRGGATASRMAATTVREEFQAADGRDIPAALASAFRSANARVFAESQQNPDLEGMGTTGSALVIEDGKAHFAHVGDSRIYLVRNNQIRQLTEDHSLVASLVREGLLSQSEADVHPRRNVLQRSIGVSSSLDVDVGNPIDVEEGDTFLLCSDGLHGLVKEDEMKEVAALPAEEAATEFVRLALERGAPDNVTVIVARVLRAPGAPGAVAGVAATRPEGEDVEPGSVDAPEKSSPAPPTAVTAAQAAAAQSRSMIPWIIGLLILLTVAGGTVYYFAVASAPSSTTQTTS